MKSNKRKVKRRNWARLGLILAKPNSGPHENKKREQARRACRGRVRP